MNGLLVGILTSLPVLLGMAIGLRSGGSRLLALVLSALVSWGAAIGVTLVGLERGWFWPLGLVTPALAGMLVSFVAWRFLKRAVNASLPVRKERPASAPAKLDRAFGGLLGAAAGFTCAVLLWLSAMLVSGMIGPMKQIAQADGPVTLPAAEPPAPNLAESLIQIANRGFIRHLPVAGELGDEVEGISIILSAPIETRQAYARHKQWDKLTELPSFRALANDPELLLELDQAAQGDLTAVYRLQKHPLFLEFVQEDAVQEIITELDAAQIAAELKRFEVEGEVE